MSSKPGGSAIADNATQLKRAESEKLLFFTKADDWAYESEIRLVYDPKESPAAKFHADSLVSIILGPRFTDERHQRLTDILNGARYENIALSKARLSKTTFSVEIAD